MGHAHSTTTDLKFYFSYHYPAVESKVILCTCQHSQPSTISGICEICMGEIVSGPAMEELLPEPRFDELYFEELEAYYENMTNAA